MLIGKDPFENKKLLSASMRVGRELTVRIVAHQRGGPGDLLPDAIQHHAGDSGHRRRDPLLSFRADGYPLGKIGVDPHHCSLEGPQVHLKGPGILTFDSEEERQNPSSCRILCADFQRGRKS
jgi:hypothetical protein